MLEIEEFVTNEVYSDSLFSSLSYCYEHIYGSCKVLDFNKCTGAKLHPLTGTVSLFSEYQMQDESIVFNIDC